MVRGLIATLCAAGCLASPALAQTARISEDRPTVAFTLNGSSVTIDRQGAACPPACVQPMIAAPGVATIGELETLDFLHNVVAAGQGLLIDARLPGGFAAGTVPGAVNVPAATLRRDNPYRGDLLEALGVRSGDFAGAYDLVMMGGGADDAQPVEALQALREAGYPADKLKYYRGGFGAWTALGLTTAVGH